MKHSIIIKPGYGFFFTKFSIYPFTRCKDGDL